MAQLEVDMALMGGFQVCVCVFFFQAEDGIRDCLLSRGLGDVYKRQAQVSTAALLL